MKNIFTYVLVLLLGLPMISKVTVFVQWKLNQEAIANSLCININKPDVMCQGTCVLNERLQNVSEKNDFPLSEIIKDYKLQPFICQEYLLLQKCEPVVDNSIRILFFYQMNYSHLYHTNVFTPPDTHPVS